MKNKIKMFVVLLILTGGAVAGYAQNQSNKVLKVLMVTGKDTTEISYLSKANDTASQIFQT